MNFLFGKNPFPYKDTIAFYKNFIVLQEYLIYYNIIFKCGENSLMFQNPFLITIFYSS